MITVIRSNKKCSYKRKRNDQTILYFLRKSTGCDTVYLTERVASQEDFCGMFDVEYVGIDKEKAGG